MEQFCIPDLCQYCSRIPFDWLHADSSISFGNYSSWDIGTASRIRTSTCPVCRLVSELLYRHAKKPMIFTFDPDTTPLCLKWDYGKDAAFPTRRCFLIGTSDTLKAGNTPIGLSFLAANHREHGQSNLLHYELPEVIDLARTIGWIKECSEKHQCVVTSAVDAFEAAYPGLEFLRYIDVHDGCVVELRDIVQYVALSYVWGSVPSFRITKANRKSLMRRGGINTAWNLLPETIRDAITLTRKLGLRYLWVDSLCLVQNDPGDLEAGIEVMDQVYERAWVTIVAVSGFNASAGLPGIEPGSRPQKYQGHEIKPGIFLGKIVSGALLLEETPHDTRAWTLQERILSRRILYFFEDQVVFRYNKVECHEKLNDTVIQPDNSLYRAMEQLEKSAFDALQVYSNLIWNYSRRSLGNDSDVLRAIGGIMRRVSLKLRYPLVQGLPVAYLDAFLLFKGTSLVRRPGFPSYSWAGWRGEVLTVFMSKFKSLFEIEVWLSSRSTWIVWYITDTNGRTAPISDQVSPVDRQALQRNVDEKRSWLYPEVPPVLFEGVLSGLPSLERMPSSMPNPKPYPLLRFWTLVVSLKILITDVFTYEARLLGKNDEDCGWVSLDGFENSESDAVLGDGNSIEVVILSEGCPQSAFFNDGKRVGNLLRLTEREHTYGLYYNVILVEWDGGIAERRGFGWIRKDALPLSCHPGPVWKEITMG
ncbi:heterokaryon incompatibility protein-domain-containing protein [Cercophora samala]|uniref:Heterokaryon incompatibility protein-domain-containing protein n=1 Tax=Cercophora samala TaxID=330535 RepID=A0AA39ZFG7_9PEZI|nr:heterokaryon incompatibility protein-domain-containing protein [Cercophora samala]